MKKRLLIILLIILMISVICLLFFFFSTRSIISPSIEFSFMEDHEVVKYNNYLYEDDVSGIFRFNNKIDPSSLKEIGWIKSFWKKTIFYTNDSELPEFIVSSNSRIKLRSDINFLNRTMIVENNKSREPVSFSFSDIILEETDMNVTFNESSKYIGSVKAVMSENENITSYFSIYTYEDEYYLSSANGWLKEYKIKPEFIAILDGLIT